MSTFSKCTHLFRMQVHMILPQTMVAKDIGNYLSKEAEQRMKQTSYEGSQIDRVW